MGSSASPAPALSSIQSNAGLQTERRPLEQTGLSYDVAGTADAVIEAWRLVYRSYRRAGLIASNPANLHSLPEIIGPQTMVACGRLGTEVVSTISSYTDGPTGLPLDQVYPDELTQLRRRGRRLAEIGLLADRRENPSRTLNSLFDLMRFGVLYDIHCGMDDTVIGVHPRHAPFYQRMIGFEIAGPERSYATVNDQLVVLLRLDLRTTPYQSRLPRGLKYFMDNRIPPEAFDQRFTFAEPALVNSDIGRFRAWSDDHRRLAREKSAEPDSLNRADVSEDRHASRPPVAA
ncbi:hypothetical protein ACERK3_17570 [Phycisphaerales bacterium AB-hyl4]|uniref:N-acyl amino acid synthase FeeM catalytic core domain-containing protein n=1 Tax=Natronomicrosphaera hydrolytica TaxID=3242702 RepID=A0ABV4UB01_9BACT